MRTPDSSQSPHHERNNHDPRGQVNTRGQDSTVQDLWENIHREMVEFMTEGTHPHMAPRADHG
ncbi:hypothetical protein A2635_05050 [Candidatus Peribacteria bacterium RIFCSPHIGHO2_01_FULL_51_9]|nr:MAG: hypothetical protein A2635_05050 [Candidatus Peribacteria bacterium RIFCSPHIGHO2_01_FULL_51_9]